MCLLTPSQSKTPLAQASNKLLEYKSSNCKVGDTPTSLFTYFATNKHDLQDEYQATMLSCQSTNLDTPDEETRKRMKVTAQAHFQQDFEHRVEESDIDIDAHGIALGNQGRKKKAADISKHRMASNCGPRYHLNNVTAYNRFTCQYLGEGLDEQGRKVRNPVQKWRGTLASCESDLKIPDDVEQDIRLLAWEAAGGDEAKLDINQFLCQIQSLPIQ